MDNWRRSSPYSGKSQAKAEVNVVLQVLNCKQSTPVKSREYGISSTHTRTTNGKDYVVECLQQVYRNCFILILRPLLLLFLPIADNHMLRQCNVTVIKLCQSGFFLIRLESVSPSCSSCSRVNHTPFKCFLCLKWSEFSPETKVCTLTVFWLILCASQSEECS